MAGPRTFRPEPPKPARVKKPGSVGVGPRVLALVLVPVLAVLAVQFAPPLLAHHRHLPDRVVVAVEAGGIVAGVVLALLLSWRRAPHVAAIVGVVVGVVVYMPHGKDTVGAGVQKAGGAGQHLVRTVRPHSTPTHAPVHPDRQP